MRMRREGLLIFVTSICGAMFGTQATTVRGQVAPVSPVKIYRGNIGDQHIEMKLRTEGKKISGTYSYDRVGQDLKLSGQLDAQGKLQLAEFDATGKQTGRFICQRELDLLDTDSECKWSKPDGTGEKYVTLAEQHLAFTNGLRILPKLINNRRTGVNVSYPQISGGAASLTAAREKFNSLVSSLINKAVKEFGPDATPGKSSFEANYSVLLGTNDLLSVEIYNDSYSEGDAHPNSDYSTVTFDLSANRELRLADLFKPNTNYKEAIITRALADINKRAAKFEKENPGNEFRMSREELSEIAHWAMTPKGLMIYFDFPHVIAALDKTFVPYSVVRAYLKPNGPAARFVGRGTN